MQIFRVVSALEGLSYLLILSVSFQLISREFVFVLGIGHGILFLIYMVLSLQVSHKAGWSVVTWLLVFFAAIVPFAFIGVEVFSRKCMANSCKVNVTRGSPSS